MKYVYTHIKFILYFISFLGFNKLGFQLSSERQAQFT